jgi:hypothetical protein
MPEALSPEWWLNRLHKQLVSRRTDIVNFDDYVLGNHPVPWLATQAQSEFRRLLQLTMSNYMGLVVDATVERLSVEGFRLGGQEPDAETWRIWQANNLDADSDEAFADAVGRGRSFFMVAPNPDDPANPYITVEDALQTFVEYEPGSNYRRRKAGLKLWFDDWTGNVCGTVFVDGFVFKYQTKSTTGDVSQGTVWEKREVAGEEWGAANPLEVVPIIEMANMRRSGQSEIYDVIPSQDRINKTLADRMMTQDFGAFPQKWASGYPEEDEKGTAARPIDIGRDRMVTSDVAETKFGQWDAAPLDPYSAAKAEDVNDIAARTRTPPQYLLGRMVNLSGDALNSAESGLVAKCRRRQRVFGERIEEVARLARQAAGLSNADAASMETIWRDPQFRTEAEAADAAVKKFSAGIVTLRQIREDLGYSEAQIKRMEEEDDTQLRKEAQAITGAEFNANPA